MVNGTCALIQDSIARSLQYCSYKIGVEFYRKFLAKRMRPFHLRVRVKGWYLLFKVHRICFNSILSCNVTQIF